MAYTKVNFVDGVTPLNAANLGKMDNQLDALSGAAVVNGQWLKGVGGAAVWSAITPQDVANIPYGTSLPASPYDGQEAILVDSTTLPSYQWRFRYNAGSTSAYKWEFVGGPLLQVNDGTSTAITTFNAWQGGFTPTITVLRAGNYSFHAKVDVSNTGAGAVTFFANVDKSSGPNSPLGVHGQAVFAAGETVMAHSFGGGVLAAGESLRVAVYANAACSFLNRILTLWPVRVA